MKALFLKKNCEVSQIRSLTLNRLVGERIFLQTTTEKLLLQSPLTTNNSDRVCFLNKQSTLKHTSVVVMLILMFLLLHFPSSGGREGPFFIKGIFEHPPRYTPTLNGESTGALTLVKHDLLSQSSNMDRQHEPIRHHSFEAGITASISKLPRQCKPGR